MDYFQKYHVPLNVWLKMQGMIKEYVEDMSLDALQVMTALSFSDNGKVPRKTLQNLLNISGHQLTRKTQTLIKAGIVYYETDPLDSRSKFVCLTALGVKFQKEFIAATVTNRPQGRKQK